MALDSTTRFAVERDFDFRGWGARIPFLNFADNWQVKVIPPFGGAMVRFLVQRHDTPEDSCVSVYLDCHDMLGIVGEPYWEVYPFDGDVKRILMNDTDELIRAIEQSLIKLSETDT